MLLPPRPPPTGNDLVKNRIRKIIAEAIVPSWFQKPPARFGEPGVGAIKTSEWRNLFTLYIPFALIGLWSQTTDSLLAMDGLSENEDWADVYHDILEVSMHLVSALLLMNKRSQSTTRSNAFRVHLATWYEGVQKIWQHAKTKGNCHAAFHVWDFIQLFGPVVFWWCYGFERLIGHMERLPHNHTTRTSSFGA
jgi:hypothetical protein